MKKIAIACISILFLIFTYIILDYNGLIKHKTYQASDFGFKDLISPYDENNNGIDDYTDILLGARLDAQNHPKYKSAYYDGGYPPENEGVCTDVIWRAFKNAGFNLKEMIDEDIKNNQELYPIEPGNRDPNIDFRRVTNLKVFFDRFSTNLTLDINDIEAWNPGDIVIFGENYFHIGIISDKRNKNGIPYLIHNAGQIKREEDVLVTWSKTRIITGHYRFDSSYYKNQMEKHKIEENKL